MKTFTCCFLFFFALSFSLFSQTEKIDFILNSEIELVHQIPSEEKENTIFFKTNFGASNILNPEDLIKIQNLVILKIELVFTTFKSSMTFDQKELNRNRLFSLQKLYPDLFQNDMVAWNLVGQTGCTSISKSQHFFHGFQITTRPTPNKSTVKKEIEYLEKVFSLGLEESEESEEFGIGSEIRPLVEIGGWDYDSTTMKINPNFNIPDSTLFKTFERNSTWKKMSVVCDFTGSMSPYTAQLLVWHQLNLSANQQRIEQFTFFNDGDRKKSNEKRIGKTGGIYQKNAGTFQDIINLAMKTMNAGNGGDLPENNIEAVIQAIKKCPECKDIILIADNFATPRDLSLLSEIKKPIKIILCGTKGGINPAYLNMAKNNNGSIHTIEEDILNLAKLNENEIINIGKNKFQFKNGKFIRIYRM